jgi:Ca2+-binding RTX toxin-like protein
MDFFDPDNLGSGGISGISLDGTRIPVYSETPYYNPLTGETSEQIKGFWIYPEGEQTWSQSLYQKINYSEYDVKANIVELFGNELSQELIVGTGQFNLVDGGSGNDIIDARKLYGDIANDSPDSYQDGMNIRLPYGSTPSTHNAPGSLLYGNAGNDQLFGSAGEDILIGGSGKDFLAGGPGDDRYYILDYRAGDTIFDDGWSNNGSGDHDVVIMPDGIGINDINWSFSNVIAQGLHDSPDWWGRLGSAHAAFHVQWNDSNGIQITLPHQTLGNSSGIDFLEFANGDRLSISDITVAESISRNPHLDDNILASSSSMEGGDGNDILISLDHSESRERKLLVGGSGMDVIIGTDAGEQLMGGHIQHDWSMDYLRTIGTLEDDGNVFKSGAGNDVISGGSGKDVYHFNLGDEKDTVTDFVHDHAYLSGQKGLTAYEESLLSNLQMDTLQFGPSIKPEDISPLRKDDDLIFEHRNGSDSIRFNNWYRSEFNSLAKVTFSDGSYWSIDDITNHLETGSTLSAEPDQSNKTGAEAINLDLLIDAIAAFDPPEGADDYVINPNMDTMMVMLAAGWQPSNPVIL